MQKTSLAMQDKHYKKIEEKKEKKKISIIAEIRLALRIQKCKSCIPIDIYCLHLKLIGRRKQKLSAEIMDIFASCQKAEGV